MKGDGGRVSGGRRETTARRRDGTEFPVEASLSAQAADGSTIFTAFIRDITPRRQFESRLLQAKEAAEAASRAKSQFLANRSEEHTSELPSLMRNSNAVFCLKKQKKKHLCMIRSLNHTCKNHN